MPLYEYQCAESEEKFEELRSASQADSGLTCPGCGSPKVARQLSAFATGATGGGSPSAASSSCGTRGFT